MEEKNSKKDVSQLFDDSTDFDIKPSKGKNVIIVILILIIISLCGVIYYLTSNNKKAQDNISSENNNQEEEIKNNSSIEQQIEILSLDDELVKELYTYIGGATKEYESEEKVLNFYQGKNVTKNDLSLEILGQGVLSKEYDKLGDKYPAEKIRLEMIKMYNLESNILFPKLSYSREGGGVICRDDVCFIEGSDSNPTSSNGKLIKAEKKEDYIYLYDEYAYIPSLESGPHCIEKITVYTDSTMLTIAGYINNTLEKIEGSDYDDDCGIIEAKHDYKLTLYKHTFKKYEDGNGYYWVSTELP